MNEERTYKVDTKIHLVTCVVATSEEEAKEKVYDSIAADGEFYDISSTVVDVWDD